MKIILAIAAFLAPAAALAADNVTLDSSIFLERQTQDAAGNTKVELEPAATAKITPGDNLVFVLSYKNVGDKAASDFVITNPLPAAITYAGSNGEAPEVSVDGGKTWGSLASLKVTASDGTVRSAEQRDVTHVRWAFARTIPAGASGKLSFRGIVK